MNWREKGEREETSMIIMEVYKAQKNRWKSLSLASTPSFPSPPPFSSPWHNPDYEISPTRFRTSRESHRALHGPGAFVPVRLLRVQSKGSLHTCQQSYIRPSQQLGHQNREQACSKLSSAIQSQVSGEKRTRYLVWMKYFIFFLSFFVTARISDINFYRVKIYLVVSRYKALDYLRGKNIRFGLGDV